jgi:hypothetical protein
VVMLQHHHIWPLTFLNFKFSDFNEELTNSLKMIWIMIETCGSAFKCFSINILDWYYCIKKCISWYKRISEIKCPVKQLNLWSQIFAPSCRTEQLQSVWQNMTILIMWNFLLALKVFHTKSAQKIKNVHFVSNNFVSKILPFMRCGKL